MPTALVPLLSLARTTDADGNAVWVEVHADVAEVLEATEPPLKERLLRKPEAIERGRKKPKPRGYLNPEYEPGAKPKKSEASRWEGPRFEFSLLLGESPTWSGPGSLWLWYWITPPVLRDRDATDLPAAEAVPWAPGLWDLACGERILNPWPMTPAEVRRFLADLEDQRNGSLRGLREARCRFCGGMATMPEYAYCLNCDRDGRTGRAPRVPAAGANGKLAGGKGRAPVRDRAGRGRPIPRGAAGARRVGLKGGRS